MEQYLIHPKHCCWDTKIYNRTDFSELINAWRISATPQAVAQAEHKSTRGWIRDTELSIALQKGSDIRLIFRCAGVIARTISTGSSTCSSGDLIHQWFEGLSYLCNDIPPFKVTSILVGITAWWITSFPTRQKLCTNPPRIETQSIIIRLAWSHYNSKPSTHTWLPPLSQAQALSIHRMTMMMTIILSSSHSHSHSFTESHTIKSL